MVKRRFIVACFYFFTVHATPMYFATAADSDFFDQLLNLISTIWYHNKRDLVMIAVGDLGLADDQKKILEQLEHVQVMPVEKTNDCIFTHFNVRADEIKMVRGWYTWKPVIFKQALDLFPYVLYIDAGISVVGSLEPIFSHIVAHHYFFIGCGHSIQWMVTDRVLKLFDLDRARDGALLDSFGMAGGFCGFDQKMRESFIEPLYELTKKPYYFEDDGTAPQGFGAARHDQAIMSVLARIHEFDIMSALRGSRRVPHALINGRSHSLDSLIRFTRDRIDVSIARRLLPYKKGVLQ